MTGAEANGGMGAAGSDEYGALLQRLEESGWASGGGIGPDEAHIGFYRLSDGFDIGIVEATERLDILDEGGSIRSGYSVGNDEVSDVLVVAYDGPRDEHFDHVLDQLVGWGEEMQTRQAEALAREEMLPWADDVTDRLRSQLTQPGTTARISREVTEEDSSSTEETMAKIVTIALPTFIGNLEPALADKFLETLFARLVDRQDNLVEADESASKAELKPEFTLLEGIMRGVRQEIVRRRDIEALAAREAA